MMISFIVFQLFIAIPLALFVKARSVEDRIINLVVGVFPLLNILYLNAAFVEGDFGWRYRPKWMKSIRKA